MKLTRLSSFLRPIYGAASALKHHSEQVAGSLERRIERISEVPWDKQEILDIGCGYLYPQVVMLHNRVGSITGVDICHFWRDGWYANYSAHRFRGFLYATARATRDYLSGWLFYRYCRTSGITVNHGSYALFRYDGTVLPFRDATFTCVISNAVLEHVEDLDAFAAETARVLRPGGIADHLWHNYYSLHGSHLPEQINIAKPWGHLTGETRPRTALFPRTPDEISRVFSNYFEIIAIHRGDRLHRVYGDDPCFEEEGAELYEAALQRRPELAQYPRELLLTRSYVIQLRKPPT
jgi:SAM-dependent methyltransferase